jgi:lysophospholipase L1-like esterase
MNILMLILIIGSIESGIRVLTKRTLTGETFRGALLQPRKWSEVKAHYQGVLERMAQGNSFLIYDPILGWTPASSSRNTTGENISSAEGLRSPRIGMTFTDRHTRHSGFSENPATIRIALLGDSMTYGNEVLCEDSWGHALEANLGADVQILNFGVSAYGLNQVLHRYERDVRPWKPQIVIIGITSLEIQRLVWIYKFLNPHWGGDPFVYPRLVFRDGTFSHINQPPTTPKEIISYSSIKELPYIHLDANYRPLEWERDGVWHLLQKSYFFRFLTSISPPREPLREGVSDEDVLTISQHVLKTMVQQVREDGATPLIVHLPYQFELQNVAKYANNYIPLSVRTLHDSDIDYFDLTPCLLEAKATDEYMPGGHYSPKANAVIGKCLDSIVRDKLNRLYH